MACVSMDSNLRITARHPPGQQEPDALNVVVVHGAGKRILVLHTAQHTGSRLFA